MHEYMNKHKILQKFTFYIQIGRIQSTDWFEMKFLEEIEKCSKLHLWWKQNIRNNTFLFTIMIADAKLYKFNAIFPG